MAGETQAMFMEDVEEENEEKHNEAPTMQIILTATSSDWSQDVTFELEEGQEVKLGGCEEL